MAQSTEGARIRRREPLFEGNHGRVRHLGGEALAFGKWFFGNKYRLMASFLGELETAPEARDERDLRQRYCAALTHARRVNAMRSFVTVLLALGVVATAFATIVNVLTVPNFIAGDVAATRYLLERTAAWTGSATVVLVALRLGFDRYLGLVDVSATFLAMQIATATPGARRA